MKKLFFLFVVFNIISCTKCKKHEETKPSNEPASALKDDPCQGKITSLEEYLKLQDLEEKMEWLKTNGKDICPESLLFDYALNVHKIDTSKPENNLSTFNSTFKMKWRDLETIVKDKIYDQYISFKYDANQSIDTIIIVKNFKEGEFMFSPVLIKAIAWKNNLKPDSFYEFGFHDLNGSNAIVIKANSNFYDLSDDPSIIDSHTITN